MANNKVTLSQLRALEALLRTRSFSRAAEELNISQPSVSNQIRAMERYCGAPLINRLGHVVEPAPLADALWVKVQTVVSLARDIEQTVLEGRELTSGELRIGYSTYQYAIPIISSFVDRYPGIKIEALSMASMDLLVALNDARVDLAFITEQDPPAHLFARKLVETRVVLMLPPSHPLSGRGTISWQEVGGLKILRREKSSITRRIFDDAAQKAGITPRHLLDLGSWGSLRVAVEQGLGAGIALREEIESRDDVAIVEIDDPALRAGHYIVCRPDLVEVASVRALFDVAFA